jgi:hypothetical protein
MINPQEQLLGWPMPFLLAFPRRELQDFQRMAIGIFKVERLDTRCLGIPIRQALRPSVGVAAIATDSASTESTMVCILSPSPPACGAQDLVGLWIIVLSAYWTPRQEKGCSPARPTACLS